MVWFGLVWFGLVWLGLVWFGLAWLGLAWLGLAWLRLRSTGGLAIACRLRFKSVSVVRSSGEALAKQGGLAWQPALQWRWEMRLFGRY